MTEPSLAIGASFDPYPGITVSAASALLDAGSDSTVSVSGLQADAPNPSDRVPVKLSVDSGTVQLGTTTGLTFTPSGAESGSTIYFAGSLTDVNAALSSALVTKDTSDQIAVSATIWDESKDFTCDTGHFYRMVDASDSYTNAKARAQSDLDGNGYLVTPTTEAENTCVFTNIVAKADSGTANITWIGAMSSYSSPTVTYSWDGGPEAGVAFWSKDAGTTGTSGSSVSSGFAHWDVETISGVLTYQPNARLSGPSIEEPCVVYYKEDQSDSTWHDVGCGGPNQYVIEGDSATLSSATITVNFSSSPSSTPTMPNTGLSIMGIVLGAMAAGGMILAATGSFSVQGRLAFAGRRNRLVALLRKTDASLRRTEQRHRR